MSSTGTCGMLSNMVLLVKALWNRHGSLIPMGTAFENRSQTLN